MLGLDPDLGALWPGSDAQVPVGLSPAQAAASAILGHCRALIDAAAPACVAVKPQLARFEVLGAAGWAALEAVIAHARGLGLLVIADGKRGDIDVTARAYAGALIGGIDSPFGRIEGLGADLATVNPLMGRDAIEPFVSAARQVGAGVLVLVRTSNPGAADIGPAAGGLGDGVGADCGSGGRARRCGRGRVGPQRRGSGHRRDRARPSRARA